MFSQPIADLALVLLQLGFAALLGTFARTIDTLLTRGVFALVMLIYIAASFAMPMEWPINAISGAASVFAFAIAFLVKGNAGWQPRVVWWYAASAMLVIVSWSALQGWFSPVILLGVAAAWAAVLSWRRGFSAAS